jgi:demethylmenaquinone methyltransferase/2-methoxy-6-polyprenyl-1,4-benzoquinol methylase
MSNKSSFQQFSPNNVLRDYFEALANKWDNLQPTNRPEMLRRLLFPFNPLIVKAHSILEIGTGTGTLLPLLRESSPQARLFAIDLAHSMAIYAQKKERSALVVQADVHQLPFLTGYSPNGLRNNKTIDFIICHNSFPHFVDKQNALKEMDRILAPGGFLLILHEFNRDKVNAIHKDAGPPIENHILPTVEETFKLLTLGGFTDVEVEDADTHYFAKGRSNGL